MSITLDDFLGHLVARTVVSSSTGIQLERVRDGTMPDTRALSHMEEARIFKLAPVLLCVDALERIERVKPRVPYISKLARFSGCNDKEGALTVAILRAHQERITRSTERALVEVYNVANRLAPLQYPAIVHQEATDDQAFRIGGAQIARKVALGLYADAFIVAKDWVTRWRSGGSKLLK